MEKNFESFWIGNVKVGGIVRLLQKSSLSTLTCFQAPGGPLVQLEHRFFFDDTPLRWKHYKFDEVHEGRSVTVSRRKMNLVADSGELFQSLNTDAIPSYAAFLILRSLIENGDTDATFNLLLDGDPRRIPSQTLFQVRGEEDVSLPDETITRLKRVDVITDGRVGNRHWIDSSVRKSDWQGAESFLTADLHTLLSDLNPNVAQIISSFTQGPDTL